MLLHGCCWLFSVVWWLLCVVCAVACRSNVLFVVRCLLFVCCLVFAGRFVVVVTCRFVGCFVVWRLLFVCGCVLVSGWHVDCCVASSNDSVLCPLFACCLLCVACCMLLVGW